MVRNDTNRSDTIWFHDISNLAHLYFYSPSLTKLLYSKSPYLFHCEQCFPRNCTNCSDCFVFPIPSTYAVMAFT